MSFRPDVDRARIDHFLGELGRAYRGPGRLYLVGGTTLVYERLRPTTLDIDLAIDVEPSRHGDLMRQVAQLKDQLGVNVEEVSPADFIPLPPGWRDRCSFIGRFGQLEVFHFDPVSTSLSKLARGYEEDIADVHALIRAEFVTRRDLEFAWSDISAHLPERGWSATQIAEFEENVALVLSESG